MTSWLGIESPVWLPNGGDRRPVRSKHRSPGRSRAIIDLLGWCRETGVEIVSLGLVSADNSGRYSSWDQDSIAFPLVVAKGDTQGLVVAGTQRACDSLSEELGLPKGIGDAWAVIESL